MSSHEEFLTKKKQTLEISENYRVVSDENNVILQFHEFRERKKKGTEETEKFEFTDNYYYPTLQTALRAFVNKSIDSLDSVEEVLIKLEEIEQFKNEL